MMLRAFLIPAAVGAYKQASQPDAVPEDAVQGRSGGTSVFGSPDENAPQGKSVWTTVFGNPDDEDRRLGPSIGESVFTQSEEEGDRSRKKSYRNVFKTGPKLFFSLKIQKQFAQGRLGASVGTTVFGLPDDEDDRRMRIKRGADFDWNAFDDQFKDFDSHFQNMDSTTAAAGSSSTSNVFEDGTFDNSFDAMNDKMDDMSSKMDDQWKGFDDKFADFGDKMKDSDGFTIQNGDATIISGGTNTGKTDFKNGKIYYNDQEVTPEEYAQLTGGSVIFSQDGVN